MKRHTNAARPPQCRHHFVLLRSAGLQLCRKQLFQTQGLLLFIHISARNCNSRQASYLKMKLLTRSTRSTRITLRETARTPCNCFSTSIRSRHWHGRDKGKWDRKPWQASANVSSRKTCQTTWLSKYSMGSSRTHLYISAWWIIPHMCLTSHISQFYDHNLYINVQGHWQDEQTDEQKRQAHNCSMNSRYHEIKIGLQSYQWKEKRNWRKEKCIKWKNKFPLTSKKMNLV